MLNSPTRFASLKQTVLKSCQVPLAGLLIALGLSGGGLNPMAAQSSETLASVNVAQAADAAATVTSLKDGVYLYGQSSEPDRLGTEYFVAEVRDGKTVGAFYMPHSSFDCFYGRVQAQQLSLTVIDSYERTKHPFNRALRNNYFVATNSNPALAEVQPQGYQRLAELSENDQRMLQMCKADLQEQVWGQ